jgi:hypothetical protein
MQRLITIGTFWTTLHHRAAVVAIEHDHEEFRLSLVVALFAMNLQIVLCKLQFVRVAHRLYVQMFLHATRNSVDTIIQHHS